MSFLLFKVFCCKCTTGYPLRAYSEHITKQVSLQASLCGYPRFSWLLSCFPRFWLLHVTIPLPQSRQDSAESRGDVTVTLHQLPMCFCCGTFVSILQECRACTEWSPNCQEMLFFTDPSTYIQAYSVLTALFCQRNASSLYYCSCF